MNIQSFDVTIIGGGLVGLALASALADSDLTVAVIEGKTSNVTIPGTLFAEFLNTVTQVKSVLENVSKAAEVISRSSDVLQNETAKMTIRLMQAHVNNIDSGWSSTNAQLDAEDAEELIVETKE